MSARGYITESHTRSSYIYCPLAPFIIKRGYSLLAHVAIIRTCASQKNGMKRLRSTTRAAAAAKGHRDTHVTLQARCGCIFNATKIASIALEVPRARRSHKREGKKKSASLERLVYIRCARESRQNSTGSSCSSASTTTTTTSPARIYDQDDEFSPLFVVVASTRCGRLSFNVSIPLMHFMYSRVVETSCVSSSFARSLLFESYIYIVGPRHACSHILFALTSIYIIH